MGGLLLPMLVAREAVCAMAFVAAVNLAIVAGLVFETKPKSENR